MMLQYASNQDTRPHESHSQLLVPQRFRLDSQINSNSVDVGQEGGRGSIAISLLENIVNQS